MGSKPTRFLRGLHRGVVLTVTVAALAAGGVTFAQRPSRDRIQKALETAHAAYEDLDEGKNADYIPVLADVPSDLFGISLVTADGKVYNVGDVDDPFSIQSISKVITLALVLQESGPEVIVDSVGVDATGQRFNSIEAIEQHQGREMNPMVNAGAIATTALVEGDDPERVWRKILDFHGAFAGRPLELNEEVYRSEAATNERNRAIATLMHAYGLFEDDPIEATDVYTRQCAINVTSADLAMIAGTLANGGKNPVTRQQVLDPQHIPEILAIMATAGMYDDTGKWLFATGLPAKSGVGGGIIAVVPGKFGIAAFSPRLDEAGNSVRAQRAIMDIARALDANPYAAPSARTAMR